MYHFLVWEILQPYPLLLFAALGALCLLWCKRPVPKRRLLLVTVPLALLFLVSLPVVGDLALESFESRFPPLVDRPSDAQAIVVLSSYMFSPPCAGCEPELDESSYDRCLRAFSMYRKGKAIPVLTSGGPPDADQPDKSSARAMGDLLLQLGVNPADLILEPRSRTTFENAQQSAKLLEQRHIHKILLVTDAIHLLRASACFRKQGLEVIPCGCHYRKWDFEFSAAKFIPKPSVAQSVQDVCHEWLGVAWYRLRGRI